MGKEQREREEGRTEEGRWGWWSRVWGKGGAGKEGGFEKTDGDGGGGGGRGGGCGGKEGLTATRDLGRAVELEANEEEGSEGETVFLIFVGSLLFF